MPKRVIGILIVAGMAALMGGAGASQQSHDTSKSTQPAQPQPIAVRTITNTTAGKVSTISRDVCAKHPNLKQCS
ncbi:MAG TPA: hypothetical protein VMU22_12900 [Rhizomicrobium sp.]|nr:hypothetical protein [Rhizomicrobium sp.]